MHTDGKFLYPSNNVLEYMDRFNIEKAIITTINRTKVSLKNDDIDKSNKMNYMLENFKKIMPKGQLSHQDVIDIAKKASDRVYKLFWFNPKLTSEEEHSNYKILEDNFKKGFCGVKIHSIFNLLKIPKDVLNLASFIQEYNEEYNKNLFLYIHSVPKVSYFNGVLSRDIAKLAKSFPDLRIIVGHAAFCMEYAIEVGTVLKNYKNVFFETSASVSYGIYRLIRSLGNKRILFGSDSPVVSPIQLEIEKILTLPIPNEEKQNILYNNVNNFLTS
ncbi:MAG: amidohydrolase family protein [Promethearchaeota archaeon]